jgi:hypothetical protein
MLSVPRSIDRKTSPAGSSHHSLDVHRSESVVVGYRLSTSYIHGLPHTCLAMKMP